MKQPKSSATMRVKQANKPLLPSFRHSRHANRLQEISAVNKTEILFNTSLIPLDIFLENKNGSATKINISPSEINISVNGECHKIENGFSEKQWCHLIFTALVSKVRMRKIGDQNVFGRNLVLWQVPIDSVCSDNNNKKVVTINLVDLGKIKSKPENEKDKNSQMKQFVAVMMAKKTMKKPLQSIDLQGKLSFRRNSGLLKNRAVDLHQDTDGKSSIWKNHAPTTTGSIHSMRRQFFQSKILGTKTQKQSSLDTSKTNRGSLMDQKPSQTLNFSINNDEYVKKRNKFDSQPYFYQQPSLCTSTFSRDQRSATTAFKNRQEATKKDVSSKQNSNPNTDSPIDKVNSQEKDFKDISCLKDHSLHKSQEEESVEQSIHRSGLTESKGFNDFSGQSPKKKEKKVCKVDEQSSQCFESKELSSSGTIYQSKYE